MSETKAPAYLPIPYLQKDALGIPFRLPGSVFDTIFLLTDKPGCGAMLGWKGMSETKARAYLPSHDLQKEAFFRLPGNVFNTFFINLQIS